MIQTMAKMMIQKLKLKQEEQLKNRPHHQICRLQAMFQYEKYLRQKEQIKQLQALLEGQKSKLNMLQNCIEDIDNTGYRQMPRIIILPEFIASQSINHKYKQFYRKTSNTFLRLSINRNKRYENSLIIENQIHNFIESIKQIQKVIYLNNQSDQNLINNKKMKILEQDLKLRSIIEQQNTIKAEMKSMYMQRKQIIDEYENISNNKHFRSKHLDHLQKEIKRYKQKIEQNFNPKQYRQYYKVLFKQEFKNQILKQKLKEIGEQLMQMEKKMKSNDVARNKKNLSMREFGIKQQKILAENKKTFDLSDFKRAKTEQSKKQIKNPHKSRLSTQNFRTSFTKEGNINSSQTNDRRSCSLFELGKSIKKSDDSTRVTLKNKKLRIDTLSSF